VTIHLRTPPPAAGGSDVLAPPRRPVPSEPFVVMTDASGRIRWASAGARAAIGAGCEGRALWQVIGQGAVQAFRMHARALAVAGVLRGPVIDLGGGRVGILCVDARPQPGRPAGWQRWYAQVVHH